jgi:hypothetical protein
MPDFTAFPRSGAPGDQLYWGDAVALRPLGTVTFPLQLESTVVLVPGDGTPAPASPAALELVPTAFGEVQWDGFEIYYVKLPGSAPFVAAQYAIQIQHTGPAMPGPAGATLSSAPFSPLPGPLITVAAADGTPVPPWGGSVTITAGPAGDYAFPPYGQAALQLAGTNGSADLPLPAADSWARTSIANVALPQAAPFNADDEPPGYVIKVKGVDGSVTTSRHFLVQ